MEGPSYPSSLTEPNLGQSSTYSFLCLVFLYEKKHALEKRACFYAFRRIGSIMNFSINKFNNPITMAARIAIPKPSMTNASPISEAVIIRVIAFITTKNKPSVRIVTGRVSRIRNGLINTFTSERITLARIADPSP